METFLEFQLETTEWMEHLISLYDIAEGCFAYYENLDLLLFRGVSNRAVHDYIKTHMTLETYRFSGGGKTGISFYLMDDTGENTLSDEAFGSGLANRYTDIKNDNHRT